MKPGAINEWLARIAWGSITLVSGYAATKLGTLTDSVATLNTNVAVLVEQMATTKKTSEELKSDAQTDRKILADHEKRITTNEASLRFLFDERKEKSKR